ncbi:hypothetical protein CERSUDRAFT_78633, partial [Gelatoporia subvermispora B]
PNLVARIVSSIKQYTRHDQSQGITHQGQVLFLDLLRSSSGQQTPLVLVVDGVDECSRTSEEVVQSILRLLCQAAVDIPYIRILIATRPEPYIMSALPAQTEDGAILRNLWTDAVEEIDGDIELFIQTEFDQRARRGNFILLEDRPDAVTRLTHLSAGLFIYAHTATRALLNNNYEATDIFDQLVSCEVHASAAEVYGRLGTLYTTILQVAFREFRERADRMEYYRQILVWLAVGRWTFSPTDLAIVGIPPRISQDFMNRLRSVLVIDGEITPAIEIRACHASFPQFLSDSARCTDPAFLVDPPSGHAMIASSLLDLLARDNVDSLRDADGNMPRMWEYAIRCWDVHLCDARYTPKLGRALRGFVETHLENWLQKEAPWDSHYGAALLVELCREVRTWCKKNGPDDGLAAALNTIIDRRVKEIVAEAAQSPDKFADRHRKRIKVWAKRGYTPYREPDEEDEERLEDEEE